MLKKMTRKRKSHTKKITFLLELRVFLSPSLNSSMETEVLKFALYKYILTDHYEIRQGWVNIIVHQYMHQYAYRFSISSLKVRKESTQTFT